MPRVYETLFGLQQLSSRFSLSSQNSSAIRQKSFDGDEKGIPLEYFEYERVFVDEIHECLCTTKDELSEAKKNSNDDTGFHKVCIGSVVLIFFIQSTRYAQSLA